MSFFIIIRGTLGVGKTTVSKKLAMKFNAEYISIDGILAKHKLDKSDKNLGFIPVENFLKADEIILPKALNFLKAGKSIVFDGCFYHKQQIQDLTEKLPFKNYVFTLKTPLEVCIERDSKRKKAYGVGAAKAVYNLVSKFDFGAVIETDCKTMDEVVKEIVPKII